jgi:hypothetical protein
MSNIEKRLTPSALRLQAEQQERDEQIVEILNRIYGGMHHLADQMPDGMMVTHFLWSLQTVIGELNGQGLLRRNADVDCVRDWLIQIAQEIAQQELAA